MGLLEKSILSESYKWNVHQLPIVYNPNPVISPKIDGKLASICYFLFNNVVLNRMITFRAVFISHLLPLVSTNGTKKYSFAVLTAFNHFISINSHGRFLLNKNTNVAKAMNVDALNPLTEVNGNR